MKKLEEQKAVALWQDIHRQTKADLKAVCFPDRSLWFNRFFDRIQKFALRRGLKHLEIPLAEKQLLDLGCGRGRWLEFYSFLGAQVTGIDISDTAVEFARKRGFEVTQGSIEKLPFAEESFDLVNSVTVLQHLPYENQRQAIKEIYRVLKKGGYAIILENTSADPAPHVWGRPLEEWQADFSPCEMVFSENHYYIFELRAFWRFPIYLKPVSGWLEDAIITLEYPLEFWRMKRNFGQNHRGGLQHLMIFRKA